MKRPLILILGAALMGSPGQLRAEREGSPGEGGADTEERERSEEEREDRAEGEGPTKEDAEREHTGEDRPKEGAEPEPEGGGLAGDEADEASPEPVDANDEEPGADADEGPGDEASADPFEPKTRPEVLEGELVPRELPSAHPYSEWTAHDPDAPRISLAEAIELALEQHPRVGVARHQVEVAEAQLGQAKASYYPQVNVWLQALRGTMNGSLTVFHTAPGMPRVGGSTPDGVSSTDSFNNFLAAATVHQLLYDFGRTQGAVASQRALHEGAKMNELLIEQGVIFEVTRAFYEVLRRREAVVVAEDGVRLTERILELARSGERAGLRPPSESARAEADVASAELNLIQARAALDVARVQFANALGGTETPLEPAGDLVAEEVPLTDEEAIESALEHRPELLAFDFQRESLRERLRSAKAGHYPRFEALAGVNSRGQFLNPNDRNFQVANWNVGVIMQVPIFQGMRVVEEVHELEAEIRALHSGQEVIHQAVVLEVKEALAQLRSADEAVRATSKGVKAAKVALDTIEGRYRTGLANIVEITDAQTAYISAVSAALTATYDQILARARLRLAIGKLGRALD